MSKIFYRVLIVLFFCISCNKEEGVSTEDFQGKNMLLMGNSFFRPYAEKFNLMAIDAGLEHHNATTVFRGGDNGRPINFWNDSTTESHALIKSTLDQGNIDYFGMTAGNLPENPTEGFKEWIEYALQNNPDVIIFLSIPPIDFPANWTERAQDYGFDTIQELYAYFVNDIVHKTLVDPLREEFPSTKIFTIPTGWATINLAQMKSEGLLLDDISMVGPLQTSIFTDAKGHQGEIVRETGGLIWLNSIYNIELSNHIYNTGFETDLHQIAIQITDTHDLSYKQ